MYMQKKAKKTNIFLTLVAYTITHTHTPHTTYFNALCKCVEARRVYKIIITIINWRRKQERK